MFSVSDCSLGGNRIASISFFLFSGDTFKADSECFLFTLVSPSRTSEPIMITPDPGAGIQRRSCFGPGFGNEEYYDLNLITNHGKLSGLDILGRSFRPYERCPQDPDQSTYFTGAHEFKISELEVFQVSF